MTARHNPRFTRAVSRVHALGPRAVGELLAESGVPLARVERYASLDRYPREFLTGVGAATWAPTLFMVSS